MARQWSARCYGVARQREGSRQNSTGVSGVLSLYPLGAWVPKNLARRSFGLLVSAARCCSTGSGRLGGAAAAGRTMERSPARSPQLAEGAPR